MGVPLGGTDTRAGASEGPFRGPPRKVLAERGSLNATCCSSSVCAAVFCRCSKLQQGNGNWHEAPERHAREQGRVPQQQPEATKTKNETEKFTGIKRKETDIKRNSPIHQKETENAKKRTSMQKGRKWEAKRQRRNEISGFEGRSPKP